MAGNADDRRRRIRTSGGGSAWGKEGKTVLITAAVHPGEYVGVETAVELANELKMEKSQEQ